MAGDVVARESYADVARRLRDDADLTLEEVSRASGLHINSIHAYEKGRRTPTKRVNVLAHAKGLGVHPADLLRAAGLWRNGDDYDTDDRVERFRSFLRGEPFLTSEQREALVRSYEAMLPRRRRNPRAANGTPRTGGAP